MKIFQKVHAGMNIWHRGQDSAWDAHTSHSFRVQLWLFQIQLPANVHFGSKTLLKYLGLCYPCEKPGLVLWLLTLFWPMPGYCGQWESEPVAGRSNLSLSLSVKLCMDFKIVFIPNKYIYFNSISTYLLKYLVMNIKFPDMLLQFYHF